MITVYLLLMVGGIGLSQAVCNPRQVTLAYLRLGGLISLALLALAGTWAGLGAADTMPTLMPWAIWTAGGATLSAAVQLIAVQLAKRKTQRVCAVCLFLFATLTAYCLIRDTWWAPALARTDWKHPFVLSDWAWCWLGLSLPVSSGLIGGFLMAMLLGHAYLTAGSEMTQSPFMRLVKVMAGLLVLRTMMSLAWGLLPFMQQTTLGGQSSWDMLMAGVRYGVGLAIPLVFIYMVHDCVKRRANQSATGILYVALVMVILGEGAALALIRSTGFVF